MRHTRSRACARYLRAKARWSADSSLRPPPIPPRSHFGTGLTRGSSRMVLHGTALAVEGIVGRSLEALGANAGGVALCCECCGCAECRALGSTKAEHCGGCDSGIGGMRRRRSRGEVHLVRGFTRMLGKLQTDTAELHCLIWLS